MIAEDLLTQTATRLAWQAGDTDAWNRPTDTHVEDGTFPMRLEPVTVDEATNIVDVQLGDHRGFALPDQDLDGRDLIVVDDVTYKLVGPPKVQRTPDGPHHLELHLRSVE